MAEEAKLEIRIDDPDAGKADAAAERAEKAADRAVMPAGTITRELPEPGDDYLRKIADVKKQMADELVSEVQARTSAPAMFDEKGETAEVSNKLRIARAGILQQQANLAEPDLPEDVRKVLEAQIETMQHAEKDLQAQLAALKAIDADAQRKRAKAAHDARTEPEKIAALPPERQEYARQFGAEAEAKRFQQGEVDKKHGAAVEKEQAREHARDYRERLKKAPEVIDPEKEKAQKKQDLAMQFKEGGALAGLAGMDKMAGIMGGIGEIVAGGPVGIVSGTIKIAKKVTEAAVEAIDKIGEHAAAVGAMSGRGAENAAREGVVAAIDPLGMSPFVQGVNAAVKGLDKFTDALIDGAARQNANYSPQLNLAFAAADIREVMRGIERAPRVERELSELVEARSRRTEAGKDLEAELIKMLAPFVVDFNKFMTVNLEVLTQIAKGVAEANSMIGGAIEESVDRMLTLLGHLPLLGDAVRELQKVRQDAKEAAAKAAREEEERLKGMRFDPFQLVGPDWAGQMRQMQAWMDARELNRGAF